MYIAACSPKGAETLDSLKMEPSYKYEVSWYNNDKAEIRNP